uniref:CSON005040 protein n=1 Tax=Culicoides sonorensis TaxID=179676 RepID=A0A336MRZ9_CULSO
MSNELVDPVHLNESPPQDTNLWKFWTKRRYVLIIMCFFGFANAYSLRVNLSDVIGYDLAKAGFTSSLPYLTMAILLGPTGYLADTLIRLNVLSTTNVRRIFNCGGFIAQTVFMMTAGYLTNAIGIITCLVFGVGLGAFALSGYAGIVHIYFTIESNFIEIKFFYITDKLDSQWKIVFIISASVYLVGSLVYWFFCSGELQPWAIEKKTDGDVKWKLIEIGGKYGETEDITSQ